ncbi:TPA: hypothetical protein ACGSTO_001277 [Vibrio parahaemolyticus]|nr:hypothetical protein [Vibrio parahaemolyticus]ELA6920887.1 hypothetical protein [Vibrio parahaemolyticus]ELA6925691.1 hypothetical protein [Vibrio parahaemolyticus]
MGNEIGGAYIGQMIAKDAMHKALYGKAKKKKASIFARVMKKASIFARVMKKLAN